MTLQTSPETEQAIQRLIASGFGVDPDEVIRRLALEKLARRERRQSEEPRELPFDKAALFLHVSEERLQRMLDERKLPFRQVGEARLIPLELLKACQEEIRQERHRLQDQTVAMEQELGIYE